MLFKPHNLIFKKLYLPKRTLFLLLLIIISFFEVNGQEPSTQRPVTRHSSLTTHYSPGATLTILSWNILMLPRWVFFRLGQIKRAPAIVDQLKESSYDLIVFQEAFDKKAKRILWNGLKENFPYQYGPGKRGLIKITSGVWIISKLPLNNGQIIRFNDCKVQDCLARKGALFVEFFKNDQKFQLIGTHLQAQVGDEFQAVRKKQYKDISEKLIKPLAKKNVPLFVIGDLNTAKSDTANYNEMLRVFNVHDGSLEGSVLVSWGGAGNDIIYEKGDYNAMLIDYILFQPNGIRPKEFKREVKIFQQRWSKQNKDLSDHYAVEAVIVW